MKIKFEVSEDITLILESTKELHTVLLQHLAEKSNQGVVFKLENQEGNVFKLSAVERR